MTTSDSPRRRDPIGALRIPTYRVFIAGQLAAAMAIWIQRIAQDWTVLQLTGDAAVVGALVLFQFGPALFLGMWGGLVVDRNSARVILLVTQTTAAAVAALLALLAFAGLLSTGAIFAAVAVTGLLALVDLPARQVLVAEIAHPAVLPNAISLNATISQLAQMIGPAVGGVLLVIGDRWAFLSAAALAAVDIVTLALVRTSSPRIPVGEGAGRGQIREALVYCIRNRSIRLTFAVLFVVSLIGINWPVLLTSVAERVFDTGATGYGLYTSALGVGALVGALLSLARQGVRLRTVYSATVGFMGFKLLAAFAPSQWLFVALIAASAACNILMWTASNTMVQTSSSLAMRGRVMSLYIVIASGGQAFGGPILGLIVEQLGARWGMALSGGIPLVVTCAIAAAVLRSRKRCGPATPG
ncbi:MAG: MFS transporter [Microbacterium sp.]|uniref:MFS transporter n=1 Tax=Microbacterium sp. TaxID=51671 RepID=UPI0039E2ECF6